MKREIVFAGIRGNLVLAEIRVLLAQKENKVSKVFPVQ